MNDAHYLPLTQTAAQLGVPAAWLRSEAEAGRVPFIRAGRRLLFRLSLVVAALDRRAEESLAEGPGEAVTA